MKRFHIAIISLAVAALALGSCKKDKAEEPDYGPANTITVDGTQYPVEGAWAWSTSYSAQPAGSSDGVSLGLSFGESQYIRIIAPKSKQGANFNFKSDQYWGIDAKLPVGDYNMAWNETPEKLAGGHMYVKRTGDGGAGDYGAFTVRFDIAFADGRRIYGNYSGNFEAPK